MKTENRNIYIEIKKEKFILGYTRAAYHNSNCARILYAWRKRNNIKINWEQRLFDFGPLHNNVLW